MRRRFSSLALAFVTLAAAPLGAAQEAAPARDRLAIEDYLEWEDVQNPRLSPDGRQIIYTRRWVDKLNDRWESSLWIMNADGSRNRFLAEGADAQWSPDGTRIAYLTSGEPAGTQIFVKWLDAEGTTQITRLTETPSEIKWSPDGQSIAFRMLVPQKHSWGVEGKVSALKPKGGKWTEPPRVVERVSYRRDRQGFVDDGFRHLFVVTADGGTPRQVTSGDWDHNDAEWMPDGKALVFTALRVEDAEYSWRESDIYTVDAATGAIKQLTSRKGPDGSPVPSPDGKLIAYSGYDSTDATWKDRTLYVMNADGSNPRALTTEFDRTPGGMTWAADGSAIYFTAENAGSRNLYRTTLGGEVRAVTEGTHVLTTSDIARNGTIVGVRSSAQRPNEVVAFTTRAPQPRALTTVNDDVLAGKKLGQVEEIWYPSADGFRVQGWVIKPPDFDATRKYPLILSIHGGPHSMYNVAFNFAWQEHAAKGYVVLYTNPRGSTGYGSAFGNAIKNAYPGKDYDDLMAGVDTVIGRGYVDPAKLFVYGCSGGGVLTSWIVGKTDRFAAASANCPVTNWLSFVGTTDGSSWYRNFAKLPWEDPTEHLARSPLMHVGNVKTPTMLMTGVMDLRTPISQTEEFYQALKILKVPTAMIRFNEEWHGTSSKPSNFIRSQLYLQQWFDKHSGKPAAVSN
ncbi:MAG TPA: S9 family peptidase [Gemmatimonadaceae bacterium]|nr:S9 family peptidase [Gemmatimonadaceae bacterium]